MGVANSSFHWFKMKASWDSREKTIKNRFCGEGCFNYRYRQDASEDLPKRGNIRECMRAAKILPDLRLYERTVRMVSTELYRFYQSHANKHSLNLRDNRRFFVPICTTDRLKSSFFFTAIANRQFYYWGDFCGFSVVLIVCIHLSSFIQFSSRAVI